MAFNSSGLVWLAESWFDNLVFSVKHLTKALVGYLLIEVTDFRLKLVKSFPNYFVCPCQKASHLSSLQTWKLLNDVVMTLSLWDTVQLKLDIWRLFEASQR